MANSHDTTDNCTAQSQHSAEVAHPDTIATSSNASTTDTGDNSASPPDPRLPTSSGQAATAAPAPLMLLPSTTVGPDHGVEADQVTGTPALRTSATSVPFLPITSAVAGGTHSGVVSLASSATASERTTSPVTYANWNERITCDKDAHNKRTCLYPKSRQMLCQTTNHTKILSSRGVDRGRNAPTKITTPSLPKRRYSIDVVTDGWNIQDGSMEWEEGDTVDALTITSAHNETDLIPQKRIVQPLPNPLRYYWFNVPAAFRPPYNDGHYLTFQDSTLLNKEFWHIRDMESSLAWMDDNPFNMALEVLRESRPCREHHIDVVTSNVTQSIWMAYATDDLGHPSFDYLRQRLATKRWIFIPINDGLGGNYSSDSGGTHWSLVVMDRVHRYAHYYDSMSVDGARIVRIAADVTWAMITLLGSENWTLKPESHTPNQWLHNQTSGDRGACGPFVWKMSDILIQRIIDAQSYGQPEHCSLSLDKRFPWEHKFNSQEIRCEMQDCIAHRKCRMDSLHYMSVHDALAVGGENVILCQRPPPILLSPTPQHSPEPEPEAEAEVAVVSDSDAASDDDDDITLEEDGGTWEVISIEPAAVSRPAENARLDDNTSTQDIIIGDEPESQHSRKRSHDDIISESSAREHSVDGESATGPPPRKRQSPPQRLHGKKHVHVSKRQDSVESNEWSA
ncbi:hypothetical protein BDU57DRAFT_127829 [Ampelomyces quisqualis]|uniref:Ubiquitin-like protease family profile domain-containing protein n=1 Tax=Ampelomyces quisqualis TaxID=50730 RepID=A0A6A5QVV2_AMPQU|nr:hypothetical protein BDU57DRAFT_127829 [Ampelomyces quisqualis]